MMSFGKASIESAKAFRISPNDTNYFVMLFHPLKDPSKNVYVIEIFIPGGATPPNTHSEADEFFYVLHGEGLARCGGKETPIKAGDAILLGPGNEHVIRNTGTRKLYCLTIMTPNEGFAELILSGEPVAIDDEDRRVLAA